MKMNAGIWIGIIGGMAGFLIAIIAVLTTTGSLGIYITLGMLALFGGMAFLFYKIFFGPMFNAARLKKTGLPGKAKILEVHDTNVTINNNPQIKLVLEVKNNFGQVYTTSCKMVISRLQPGLFQPGMEVPVKIDPKNEKNVVIDTGEGSTGKNSANSSPAWQQPDAAQWQAELAQMQQDNDAIRLSGRSARAIIKNYTWLGAHVNGNNPYAELELEILPDNAAAFSGKARGVIGEDSVEKFQPGKEIFVKYDLYDNSKVTIDHS
jgi:hypothetical protein